MAPVCRSRVMKRLAQQPGTHSEGALSGRRAAFSLLEVLLALGIFLTAFVALSQLSSNGMNAAVEARLRTKAILRCESKLAEIVAAWHSPQAQPMLRTVRYDLPASQATQLIAT